MIGLFAVVASYQYNTLTRLNSSALNEKDRNDTEAQLAKVHNEEISNQPAPVRDSIQQYFQQIAPDLQQSLQQAQQAWSKFDEFIQTQGDNLKEVPT